MLLFILWKFMLSILMMYYWNKDDFSEFLKLRTENLPKWETCSEVAVSTQSICSTQREVSVCSNSEYYFV